LVPLEMYMEIIKRDKNKIKYLPRFAIKPINEKIIKIGKIVRYANET